MSNLTNNNLTYNDLVKSFQINPRDVQTHPMNANAVTPKWFHTYVENNEIYVCNSKSKHSSLASIQQRRKISRKEFETMYDLYLRREKGDTVSQIAQQESQNSSYWFGILFATERQEKK